MLINHEYPEYARTRAEARAKFKILHHTESLEVIGVYSLKQDKQEQLAKPRVFNYD